LSNVNSSITEHNESAEHSSTLSPSNLSKSSIKEQSTENSSGEDEEVNDRDSWKSPRTSGEWHEQIGQQKRRKKSGKYLTINYILVQSHILYTIKIHKATSHVLASVTFSNVVSCLTM